MALISRFPCSSEYTFARVCKANRSLPKVMICRNVRVISNSLFRKLNVIFIDFDSDIAAAVLECRYACRCRPTERVENCLPLYVVGVAVASLLPTHCLRCGADVVRRAAPKPLRMLKFAFSETLFSIALYLLFFQNSFVGCPTAFTLAERRCSGLHARFN